MIEIIFYKNKPKILIYLWLISIFLNTCQNNSKAIRDVKESDDTYPLSSQEPLKYETKIHRLSISEWNSSKEGFLDSSSFQVKVSSLKSNRLEALEEANEVAKRKMLRMLLAEAIPTITPDGRVDLRILIEEYGKIVSDTDFSGEKFHFVYQIKRPALEIIVKEKIK
jgi:hypothetical protein